MEENDCTQVVGKQSLNYSNVVDQKVTIPSIWVHDQSRRQGGISTCAVPVVDI